MAHTVDKPSEIARICALPKRVSFVDTPAAQVADWTPYLAKPGCEYTLKPVQSAALAELYNTGGLFGPIGVGHGKTLIALLAPTVLRADVAVIFTKANNVEQMSREWMRMREHFHLRTAYVRSYDSLSRRTGSTFLEDVYKSQPNMVIVADEAHLIANPAATRTMRIVRFLRAHVDVKFVALSGTMTSRTIKQFHHLLRFALSRTGAPVPCNKADLEQLASVIDADGRGGEADFEWAKPLCTHMGVSYPTFGLNEDRRTAVRTAYRLRMEATQGVIATASMSTGCSLEIITVDSKENPDYIAPVIMPDNVKEAIKQAETLELDPDGKPLMDFQPAVFERRLAEGFFYRWVWPGGVPDKEWLEARKEWARHVRAELRNNATDGYDSPLLVGNQVVREIHADPSSVRVPGSIHAALLAWAAVRKRPEPPTEAVWLSDYLLQHALTLCDTGIANAVLLWVSSMASAEKLELISMQPPNRHAVRHIRPFGQVGYLDVVRAGRQPPEKPKAKITVLSERSHGDGHNMQSWAEMVYLSPSCSGKIWDQSLGRSHRQGQSADCVTAHVYAHCPQYRDALRKALRQARYMQETIGNPHRLLFADWDREPWQGMARGAHGDTEKDTIDDVNE